MSQRSRVERPLSPAREPNHHNWGARHWSISIDWCAADPLCSGADGVADTFQLDELLLAQRA